MNPDYPDLAVRAGHRCEYCRAPERCFNFRFEVEHIVPSSRKGPDDFSNLALGCRSCNVYKSDQVEKFDDLTQSMAPLFHPRLDQWHEHFSFDLESYMVVARTAIGRVTIVALRMNQEMQIEARKDWAKLDLFP